MKGLAAGGLTVAWVILMGVLVSGPIGMALFGLAAGLAGMVGLVMLGPIDSIKVERALPRGPVRSGDTIEVTWRVSTARRWPWFSLTVEDAGLTVESRLSLVFRASGLVDGHVERVVRGVRRLDTVVLTVTDPFGLVRRERRLSLPGELEVWPVSVSRAGVRSLLTDAGLRARQAPASRKACDGSASADRTRGVRAYQPGDPPRLVHWPATAKTGSLLVRQFESAPEALQVVVEQPRTLQVFELALSQAAGLVDWGLRHGWSVGLATPAGNVPAGRGPTHLRRLMRLLALSEPTDRSPEPEIMALSWRGAVVLRIAGEGRA